MRGLRDSRGAGYRRRRGDVDAAIGLYEEAARIGVPPPLSTLAFQILWGTRERARALAHAGARLIHKGRDSKMIQRRS